ncbi:MAG: NUMOD3 domain-containing DNA-binding protein [Dehalococcoidales bacterium]|jgi:hypothetical protein|nr:NUMOD3 domain-containing DNA-binding protein [Dehalococcoidales bacterium]
MRTKIYFLRENHFVRYVGKTSKTLNRRFQSHLDEARRGKINHRCNGIRAALRQEHTLTITLQTEVEGNGEGAERAYIKWLRSKGIELWNQTDGGEGKPGYSPSQETRRKIGDKHRGIPRPLEVRIKISEGNKGRVVSEETKKRMREGHKGLPSNFKDHHHTKESKRKLRESNLGKSPSEETREKLRVANKGRVPWNKNGHCTQDTKNKISKGLIGIRRSKETRQKISKAKLGTHYKLRRKQNEKQ